MTTDELYEKFENIPSIRFEDIPNKFANRPDLHAFSLLEKLVPAGHVGDMISAAGHDEVYLDVDLEALAKVITDEQIQELVTCGLWISDGSLGMFV